MAEYCSLNCRFHFLPDTSSARREFLALRDQASSALLATLSQDGSPAASYAPLVWLDGRCYLFLSELASHTRNLKRCPSLSLMLIEPEAQAANAFARRRITLQGNASLVARGTAEFELALAEFHRRFGKIMELIEPLPDFQLFRLSLHEGRFVKGFGQAYALSGEHLDELTHVSTG
jgi:putative heme iron utilization protein